MDLESKMGTLTAELNSGSNWKKPSNKDFLPRLPETHSLLKHRQPITCVKFHPVFSVMVSCSADATIKVWDFETGEFEKTLKGHTGS